MKVEARKKSTDPVQEALRTHKDKWNLAAKEFISRIIAFKRALNGRGDAHYSLPPSNIKDPLPESISSFLSTLSSNYEQLASEALKIEQEQASYSSNRKKTAPKAPEGVQPPVLPVAAAIQDKLINKYAFQNNTTTIRIGEHKLDTILAISSEEQQVGLMGKEWPPPVMSFVYSSPRVNRFWMKNTPSPLDIVFALNGKIIDICKGEPHSTAMIGDWKPSDLVVELPFGTCAKLGVAIGDDIGLAKDISEISASLQKKYASCF